MARSDLVSERAKLFVLKLYLFVGIFKTLFYICSVIKNNIVSL